MDSRTEKMELMLDRIFNCIKDCQSLAADNIVNERTFFNDLEDQFAEQFSSLLSVTREARYHK